MAESPIGTDCGAPASFGIFDGEQIQPTTQHVSSTARFRRPGSKSRKRGGERRTNASASGQIKQVPARELQLKEFAIEPPQGIPPCGKVSTLKRVGSDVTHRGSYQPVRDEDCMGFHSIRVADAPQDRRFGVRHADR